MSLFFDSITKVLSIINPLLTFVVLLSVVAFLSFLRVKVESYFKDIKRIANSLEEIAYSKNNRYY